jgi:ankyrin repeat protein
LFKGNENVVKILLENGASIDACDSEDRTALRAAVFSGHEHIVKLLLNYNANGNIFVFLKY